jgi:hypothetical protein
MYYVVIIKKSSGEVGKQGGMGAGRYGNMECGA